MKKKIEGSGGGGSRGENQSVNTVEGEKKKCDGSFSAPIWLAYGAQIVGQTLFWMFL